MNGHWDLVIGHYNVLENYLVPYTIPDYAIIHMKFKRLQRSFYTRDTHIVARELLGKILVRSVKGNKITGRITEVEAYVGEDDLACHASRGRTPRTDIMYGKAGHAYIYLIYGMYDCLNIVTDQKNFPAAVLIRSLEPLEGINDMIINRKLSSSLQPTPYHLLTKLTTGPGKLTQALNITRTLNGEDLTTSQQLYVADDGFTVAAHDVAISPRIGVNYAGPCALYPWRYYLKDSQFLSKKDPTP